MEKESNKQKVIRLLNELYGLNKSDVSCDLYYDRVALEKLYHASYIKNGKVKCIGKGRSNYDAWKKAYSYLLAIHEINPEEFNNLKSNGYTDTREEDKKIRRKDY